MTTLRNSQLQLAAHLRNPEHNPAPEGIEERRLQIYRELVFNNIRNILASGFPVLHSLYTPEQWADLVRAFIETHRCHTPYFPELGQEFLDYLMHEHGARDCDPAFLLELAHYEWVELALDVAQEELPAAAAVPEDIAASVLQLSPLAWVLGYQYPVHRIGPDYRPEPAATWLAVYRNREDAVKFMELTATTARLLELLRDGPARPVSELLAILADEIGMSPVELLDPGVAQLHQLLELGVVLPASAEPALAGACTGA